MAKKKHRSYLFEERECRITSLTTRGWGQGKIIACADNPARDAEVQGALPGDLVKAQIRRIENSILQCETVEILESGVERIPVRCSHCGKRTDKNTGCGGCTLQCVSYETQLELKTNVVKNALKDQGLQEIEVKPIIAAPNPWEYRNKMEFSFGPHGEEKIGCGLHPSGYKFEVLELEQCYLVPADIIVLYQAVLRWARENELEYFVFRKNSGFLRLLSIREGRRSGERMIILTTSGDNEVSTREGLKPAHEVMAQFLEVIREAADKTGEFLASVYWTRWHAVEGEKSWLEDVLLTGCPVLHEELVLPAANESLHFDILPHAFYQPNSLQAEVLYNELLTIATPYLTQNMPVLDLYCGTGTIALCFALKGHHAIGIDIEKQAIENARANAIQNNLQNVTFYAGDCGKVLEELVQNGDLGERFVIVDPPRRGLLPGAYKQLLKLQPKTLLYVSCNPLSLAEDLKKFQEDGYSINFIQPVDMLPQTAHIESIALLRR